MYAHPTTIEIMTELKIPIAPFLSEDLVSSVCKIVVTNKGQK